MNLIIVAVAVIFITAAIIVAVIKPKAGLPLPTDPPRLYCLRESLFTPAERSFLGVLESLDFEGVTITAKVRLADIVGIKPRTPWKERQRALNRITSRHVDFLLIARRDGRPLLGLELVDRSPDEDDRAACDEFVDDTFASAGIPLLHIPARSQYDLKDIHRQICAALDRNSATEPVLA
jgi:hypothetical protein